jgi:6-aminohexanoate-oligomer endohydrolase
MSESQIAAHGNSSKLSPHIPTDQPYLEFDFPELRVGCAEYREGPTGVTVFHFPRRVFAAVDCRGASPATCVTDVLRCNYGKFVNGIVFAGGSTYGLEAACGVAARLLSGGSASARWPEVAIVPSAAIFDFRGRTNSIYPDWELGAAALDAAREGYFPLGACGAGRFAHCGKLLGNSYMERAGQGAAFGQFGNTKIAVFTVVNAIGCLRNRSGTVILGNRDPVSGIRLSADDALRVLREKTNPGSSVQKEALTGNTTLTLVVINRETTHNQLQRLAIETHTSMARAIQPFHTSRDGDTPFAVTTGEDCTYDPEFDEVCLYASELAWSAVLSCVFPDQD